MIGAKNQSKGQTCKFSQSHSQYISNSGPNHLPIPLGSSPTPLGLIIYVAVFQQPCFWPTLQIDRCGTFLCFECPYDLCLFFIRQTLTHSSKYSRSMITSKKVLSLLQEAVTELCWTLDVTMSIFVLLFYLLEYSSYKKISICLLICKLLNKKFIITVVMILDT